MDIITFLVSIALIGGALFLVMAPLRRQNPAKKRLPAAGQTLAEAEARYQAALTAIKDLMFDYEMGKIRPEDYDALLVKSKLQAARLKKEADRLRQVGPISPALDAQIEAAVAQIRQSPQTALKEVEAVIQRLKIPNGNGHVTTCPTCNARMPITDAYCACCGHAVDAASPRRCAACNAPAQPGDLFCARCGAPLESKNLSYGQLSTI